MITLSGFQNDMMTLEKRRKAREQREREDQSAPAEREPGEPLTAAHIVGQAMMDDAPSGPAEKAIADRGATAGPGEGLQPGQIEPADYRRPFIRDGRAAPSPLHGPPNQSGLPDMPRGVPTPIQVSPLPAISGSSYGPAAAGLAQHYARAARSVPPAQATKRGTP